MLQIVSGQRIDVIAGPICLARFISSLRIQIEAVAIYQQRKLSLTFGNSAPLAGIALKQFIESSAPSSVYS